jgi:predicted transposase YdaD
VSKPYDATIKDLAAQGPADFVSWFDGPTTRPVTLLNVDLSTVTTAADVVFGIGEPVTEILQLAERLEREAVGDQADRLLTTAYILTGLRLKAPNDVRQLFQGVSIAMRESVTYQAILEEGREEGRKEGEKKGWKEGRIQELHRVILRLGQRRFGEAGETIRVRLRRFATSRCLKI